MLYAFFWVIPWRLNFICRRFGTLFHLHRQVGMKNTNLPTKMEQNVPKRRHIKFRHRQVGMKNNYLSMKVEQAECSATSAYKIQA